MWDGTRILAPPQFAFGARVANPPHPNVGPFGANPGVTGGTNFILDTRNRTWNASLTKVAGQHTFKTGYYYFRSLQRRGAGNVTGNISFANDANNPLDTTFGFSNAAIGVFSTYTQSSRWAEGAYLAINHEAFIQDNWRVKSRLTLDYGVRFVTMRPQYDSYGYSANFLPEQWNAGTGAAAVRGRLRRTTCIPAPPPTAARWIRRPARCWGRTRRWPSARSCPTPARRPTACSRRAGASAGNVLRLSDHRHHAARRCGVGREGRSALRRPRRRRPVLRSRRRQTRSMARSTIRRSRAT